jgi:hypothetical protein
MKKDIEMIGKLGEYLIDLDMIGADYGTILIIRVSMVDPVLISRQLQAGGLALRAEPKTIEA